MFKKLLLGLAVLGFASPSFAQSVPSVSVGVSGISSNISCRNKARSKFLEFSATDMSDSTSNSQWASINGMKAFVWCRDTQTFIVVSGSNYSAVTELRDELLKIF